MYFGPQDYDSGYKEFSPVGTTTLVLSVNSYKKVPQSRVSLDFFIVQNLKYHNTTNVLKNSINLPDQK